VNFTGEERASMRHDDAPTGQGFLGFRCLVRGRELLCLFEPVTVGFDVDDLGAMEKTIDEGDDVGGVWEDLTPLREGLVPPRPVWGAALVRATQHIRLNQGRGWKEIESNRDMPRSSSSSSYCPRLDARCDQFCEPKRSSIASARLRLARGNAGADRTHVAARAEAVDRGAIKL
jgi:hypothetical protein